VKRPRHALRDELQRLRALRDSVLAVELADERCDEKPTKENSLRLQTCEEIRDNLIEQERKLLREIANR
jgi:hypothetical protein